MLLAHILTDDIRALRQGAEPVGDAVAGLEREKLARFGDRASRNGLPVLIDGEPGSGAQALARAIHECGERNPRPFIVHQARQASPGGDAAVLQACLREAQGGTLFIQDVEGLSPEAQERLSSFLGGQGAPRTGRSDTRVAAVGQDLAGCVRDGGFREDLYYRLQVLTVSLRPLRAEREAIAGWARALIERLAADEGKRIRGLSAEAASLLARYDWPGNLRQLENIVYRAVLLAEGPFLTPAEFPQIAAHVQGQRPVIPPLPAVTPATLPQATPMAGGDPHALPLMTENGEMRSLADLEAQAIRFALVHYQGHMSAISRRLGIGRSTLYRKLKELGLDHAAA
jgi:DNA-binding NtrC family response regulator